MTHLGAVYSKKQRINDSFILLKLELVEVNFPETFTFYHNSTLRKQI